MDELEWIATVAFDLKEGLFANGRATICGGLPVSRVLDGSSNCQLSNGARISENMPVSPNRCQYL